MNIRFRPKLLDTLHGYERIGFTQDLSSGITVGVLALPLAMAFAIASGMSPTAGIWTAIVAGLLISLLGGSRVQIGGPTGAFIPIIYAIVVDHGVQNLLIATMMSGVMLLAMGAFRLGSMIRFIPLSVVIGFTNGIAVVIFMSQIKDFLGLKIDNLPGEFFAKLEALYAALPTLHLPTIAVACASLAVLVLWNRRAVRVPWMKRLPGPLSVLIIGTLVNAIFSLPVDTIGSRFGGIPQELPEIGLPELSLGSLGKLIAPALTIALLGAIESLLSARVADSQIDDRHDPNQELMAQGIANVVAPLFGGFAATGAIARTATNIRTGGRTPVAGIIHALVLLAIVLVLAPFASYIPLATLSAIVVVVSINMGEWHAFSPNQLARYTLAYRMFGSLFFGAANKLENLLLMQDGHPDVVILDTDKVINIDTTGLDILQTLHRNLQKRGATLILCGLNSQPGSLVFRSGFLDQLGDDNVTSNITEALIRAQRIRGAGPEIAYA